MGNIPKVIHYCWFGKNKIPDAVQTCIRSWKKYCPEYKIIQWDESNYNIKNKCKFVQGAYEKKKWAFVSDYARLEVIYKFGGIYLDTDVELIKSLDFLIEEGNGFFGFEKDNSVASGLGFAAKRGEIILKEMMEYYQKIDFDEERMSQLACPIINTNVLLKHGLKLDNTYQLIEGIKILPKEYLCPEDIYTGKIKYTINTVSIHHYNASWMSEKERKRMRVIVFIKRIIPKTVVQKIQVIIRKIRKNKC